MMRDPEIIVKGLKVGDLLAYGCSVNLHLLFRVARVINISSEEIELSDGMKFSSDGYAIGPMLALLDVKEIEEELEKFDFVLVKHGWLRTVLRFLNRK